jgi:hypothetical protein
LQEERIRTEFSLALMGNGIPTASAHPQYIQQIAPVEEYPAGPRSCRVTISTYKTFAKTLSKKKK